MFYWFFAMITGSTEQHPFGYPVDMLLVLHDLSGDEIRIKTNPIFSEKPFQCDKEESVKENRFIMTRKMKNRWLTGEVLPFCLLGLCLLLLGLWMDVHIFIKGVVVASAVLPVVWRIIKVHDIIKRQRTD